MLYKMSDTMFIQLNHITYIQLNTTVTGRRVDRKMHIIHMINGKHYELDVNPENDAKVKDIMDRIGIINL